MPAHFHFTGPFTDSEARPRSEFPWERLTGAPLIYASLGTLQTRQFGIFRSIAEACHGLKSQGQEAQLVISTGGGCDPCELGDLPGSPIVVSYAPQLELLRRAHVTIAHAGMNTVLESLSFGVPLLAIPITNDQPGMAARVQRSGAGVVLPFRKVNPRDMRSLIERVLRDSSYGRNAARIKDAIANAPGLEQAADICETALTTGRPVLAASPQILHRVAS